MLNHHLIQKFKLIGRDKFNNLINTLIIKNEFETTREEKC